MNPRIVYVGCTLEDAEVRKVDLSECVKDTCSCGTAVVYHGPTYLVQRARFPELVLECNNCIKPKVGDHFEQLKKEAVQ